MHNMSKGPQLVFRKPSAFTASHCQNCAAGWTRTGKDGGLLIVCLLDRESVLPDMVACDRYEPKEGQPS
jgi:hypothetical protein